MPNQPRRATITNHKPATVLPFSLASTKMIVGAIKRPKDRAYLVHAANAYPRLVALLGELIAADDVITDGTHGGPFGAALDPARALLRELGEEA